MKKRVQRNAHQVFLICKWISANATIQRFFFLKWLFGSVPFTLIVHLPLLHCNVFFVTYTLNVIFMCVFFVCLILIAHCSLFELIEMIAIYYWWGRWKTRIFRYTQMDFDMPLMQSIWCSIECFARKLNYLP